MQGRRRQEERLDNYTQVPTSGRAGDSTEGEIHWEEVKTPETRGQQEVSKLTKRKAELKLPWPQYLIHTTFHRIATQ